MLWYILQKYQRYFFFFFFMIIQFKITYGKGVNFLRLHFQKYLLILILQEISAMGKRDNQDRLSLLRFI